MPEAHEHPALAHQIDIAEIVALCLGEIEARMIYNMIASGSLQNFLVYIYTYIHKIYIYTYVHTYIHTRLHTYTQHTLPKTHY